MIYMYIYIYIHTYTYIYIYTDLAEPPKRRVTPTCYELACPCLALCSNMFVRIYIYIYMYIYNA